MPGTVSDPQRQKSLPPSLQHRTDLGPSREDRRRLESGHSTNGYSSGTGTGRERVSSGARIRPKQSVYKPNHPLLGEIERLMASCDSHEREIRAAQNTINHQLAEWAGKFDTLHELDTKAEQMAFKVKRMTQNTSKDHTELVDSCIRDAQGWVEDTRDNMQLWKQTDHDREPSDVIDEKEQVMYTWKQWEAQIELVKRQYENEQERLDRLIADKKRSQNRKSNCIYGILGTLIMAVVVVWILLWTFEWKQPTTLP